MNYKLRITAIAAAAVMLAAATFAFLRFDPQKVRAFNPQPDPPGFGMFEIAENQSVRINVVNTGFRTELESPPDPCRVVMTFRDQHGNVIIRLNGTQARRVELVPTGESISFDIEQRGGGKIRPDVRIQQPDQIGDATSPPDPCIPSVEVIGGNGHTQFMVPFVSTPVRQTVNQ